MIFGVMPATLWLANFQLSLRDELQFKSHDNWIVVTQI